MVDFTGYTPGPWEIEYGQLHPSSEKSGYTIRTDAFDVVSGHLAIRREEDAQLIASAPDLLAERNRLTEDRRELIESLCELVSAMKRYEMDVDDTPPYRHKDMMHRARATLDKIKAREVE